MRARRRKWFVASFTSSVRPGLLPFFHNNRSDPVSAMAFQDAYRSDLLAVPERRFPQGLIADITMWSFQTFRS